MLSFWFSVLDGGGCHAEDLRAEQAVWHSKNLWHRESYG